MSSESLKQFDNMMNAVRRYEQYVKSYKSVKVKKTSHDPNHEPYWLTSIHISLDKYQNKLNNDNLIEEERERIQDIIDKLTIKYKEGKKKYKKWLIERISKEEE